MYPVKQWKQSNDGPFHLTMWADGNLVLYNAANKPYCANLNTSNFLDKQLRKYLFMLNDNQ